MRKKIIVKVYEEMLDLPMIFLNVPAGKDSTGMQLHHGTTAYDRDDVMDIIRKYL